MIMKISELKNALKKVDKLNINLPNGTAIPAHFHLTEFGLVTRTSVDCGQTYRKEETATMQLWYSNDYWHRLSPEKFLGIIEQSEKKFKLGDIDIEVEYQTETIGRYGLDFNGSSFHLVPKHTECKADDACGIPGNISNVRIKEKETSCCSPASGCC